MVNHQIPMENIRLINLSFKTFAQKGRSSRAASMLQVNDACDLLLTCLMLAAEPATPHHQRSFCLYGYVAGMHYKWPGKQRLGSSRAARMLQWAVPGKQRLGA